MSEALKSVGHMRLEKSCPDCKGTGGHDERECRWNCRECNGTGYVPTDIGKEILALIRHNFKPMLQDATEE